MPKCKSFKTRSPKDDEARARLEEARERHRQKKKNIEKLRKDTISTGAERDSAGAGSKGAHEEPSISASGFKKPSRATTTTNGNKKPQTKKRKSSDSAKGETDAKKTKLAAGATPKSPLVDAGVQELETKVVAEVAKPSPPGNEVAKEDPVIASSPYKKPIAEEELRIVEQVSTPAPLKLLPKPDIAPEKLEFKSSGLNSAISQFRHWEGQQRKAWRKYDQQNKDLYNKESPEGKRSKSERPKYNMLPLDGLRMVTLCEHFSPDATTLGKWDQFGLDVVKLGRYLKERREYFEVLFDIRIGVSEAEEVVFPRQYSTYIKAVRDLVIDFPTRVAATVDLERLNAKMAAIEADVAKNKDDVAVLHDEKRTFQGEVEMGLHPSGVTVDTWHLREPVWWDKIRRFDQKEGWCLHMADVRKLVLEIQSVHSKDPMSQMRLALAAKEAEKEVAREKSRLKNAGRRRSSGKKSSPEKEKLRQMFAQKPSTPEKAARSPPLEAGPTSPKLPRNEIDEAVNGAIEDDEGASDDELPEFMLEFDRELDEQQAAGA